METNQLELVFSPRTRACTEFICQLIWRGVECESEDFPVENGTDDPDLGAAVVFDRKVFVDNLDLLAELLRSYLTKKKPFTLALPERRLPVSNEAQLVEALESVRTAGG